MFDPLRGKKCSLKKKSLTVFDNQSSIMNAHLESWQINGTFFTDHYALKLVHHVISWKEHVVLHNFGHEKDGCNFDHWPVYWKVVLNMGIPCMIIFKVILRTVLDKFHDNIVQYRYASKNHTLHKFCGSNATEWCVVTHSGFSIHDGTLLHPKVNTLQLSTVGNASRILTLVWQILELQQLRVMSSGF
jgi:hypothetical protein